MKKIYITLLLLSFILSTAAKETTNSIQARKLFEKTYQMVFGPQGSSLHYNVNIIGIYKTQGDIIYKGNKSKFEESRYASWNDGHSFYKVDKKKKTVEIYDPNAPDRDKYASKFTFVPDNYTYSLSTNQTEYTLTINAKKGVDGIKHVKAVIDKKSGAPKSLRIKLLWFWTTVKISNFHSGNINDHLFVFPKSRFKGYQLTDKR